MPVFRLLARGAAPALSVVLALGIAGPSLARSPAAKKGARCTTKHTLKHTGKKTRKPVKSSRAHAATKHPACTGARAPTHRPPPSSSGPSGSSGSSGSSSSAGAMNIGLVANTQGWGNNADRRLATVADRSGVHWLREEFDWDVVQATAGTFDWSRYDILMTGAAHHGVHILPLLMEPPSWAASTFSSFPGDPATYATFVSAVVARYGPGGVFWTTHPSLDASVAPVWFELWNEPYYTHTAGGVYDPPGYARLVRTAVTAARLGNPRARFLIGMETTGQQVGSDWVTWTEALYQADPNFGDVFDGVAVHPYSKDFTATPPTASDFNRFNRFDAIHQTLAAHGDGAKPFWITEIGYTTCQGTDKCVSESQQAADLRQAYTQASQYAYVKAMFIYCFIDDVTGVPTDGEQWYGLLRQDGTPKPAWDVFQSMLADNPAR
jgi:hypothetical protein